MHLLLVAVRAFACIGTVASAGYYLLCLWSAAAFSKDASSGLPNSEWPPVSILKPLKGTDPEMYASLRSHCLQDYPAYEIIFGVSEADDPAVPLIDQLKLEFPKLAIRVVECSRRLGTNIKVSNLIQMLREARYEYLVVNDSDIRVESDYLQNIVRELDAPDTGMVTCLYRGVAAETLGSQLESLGISSDFAPGVLVARQIEGGVRFGLGSTLVLRRADLARIGGFESIVDYLADDYELGNRIAGLGKRVALSHVVVETFLPEYSFSEFLRHQVRWARSVRDSRRWGYVGLVLTFGIPWALTNLLVNEGSRWAWALFVAVVALRFIVAWLVGGKALRDATTFSRSWLLPLRDFVALGVWIASFAGHTIAWRGQHFTLKNGKLVPVAESKPA
jgi:ceramide glucosyltransferase